METVTGGNRDAMWVHMSELLSMLLLDLIWFLLMDRLSELLSVFVWLLLSGPYIGY